MTAAVVALGVAVLLLSVLVAGLLRSHAEILRALHELGAGLELDSEGGQSGPAVADGVPAPRRRTDGSVPDTLVGTTLDDEVLALSLDGDVLLAFLSSSCTTCQAFWTAFAGPVDDVPGGARLVVVTRDLDEESESALRQRRPGVVPLVHSTQAWESFDVPGSPYFVLVSGGRVAGEGSGASWPQVADLLGQSSRDSRSSRDGRDRATRGRRRERRDDVALLAAGIAPGHDSLT
ncbi:MAG: hypothetical protein JWM64_2362 [Frankiales bacterium]|nr:hypothetical protein [Frankiales bacterium]